MLGMNWLRDLLAGVVAVGWVFMKGWVKMLVERHPLALWQAAKDNDVSVLRDLLSKLPRRGEGRRQFLEFQEVVTGWTPLMVAAARGHDGCVVALMQDGALVQATDRQGRTAIHLAAQNAHGSCVAHLLQRGADPFTADTKGYTALDHALALDGSIGANEALVAALLQRAPFVGWLNLKVVKLGGLRRVWERRWCIITPRRNCPLLFPDDSQVYLQLTWFRAPADFRIYGKVWLNGGSTTVAIRDGHEECALTLERYHDRPSDAFTVTDPATDRHSLFLRPQDDAAASILALRSFVAVVNSAGPMLPPEPEGGEAGGEGAGAGDEVEYGGQLAADLESDEDLARRLQEEELSEHPLGSRAAAATLAAFEAASGASGSALPTAELQELSAASAASPSAPPWPATGGPATGGEASLAEDGLCVICQEGRAEAGFLHGSSMHRCICKPCARLYQRPGAPNSCPMCRAPITQVVVDIW